MNPLHADKALIVRNEYAEEIYLIWEEGSFTKPLAILNWVEAERLIDALREAKKRKLPARHRL